MNIQAFHASFPKMDVITSIPNFFSIVKEQYPSFRQKDCFSKYPEEAIYIYQITQAGKKHTGIVAATSVKNYIDGRIKRHENTIEKKEERQLELLLMRQAAVKPVTLVYQEVSSIQDWINQQIQVQAPSFEFKFPSENKQHRIWIIQSQSAIAELQSLFDLHIDSVYIADGHHRLASTARAFQTLADGSRYEQLFCHFLSSTEMEILEFNRIVDIPELSIPTFLNQLSEIGHIEGLNSAQKPKKTHDLTFFYDNEWYKLEWQESLLQYDSKATPIPDTQLLNEYVLKAIMGIDDIRTDHRIRYIEGPKGLGGIIQKLKKEKERIAFCLHPITMEALMKIADLGEVLPPKSTWFEPRMVNGVMVLEY